MKNEMMFSMTGDKLNYTVILDGSTLYREYPDGTIEEVNEQEYEIVTSFGFEIDSEKSARYVK